MIDLKTFMYLFYRAVLRAISCLSTNITKKAASKKAIT